MRYLIGFTILSLLFISGCEKDSFIDHDPLTNTDVPLSLDIENGSTPEFISSVEEAMVDSSEIELDWSKESLKPFSRGRKSLVIPVKNSPDYVLFYEDKGKTLYKYLHPLSDQDADKIFEERMFQVVNDDARLSSIGKFAGQAGEKIARLDTRTRDTPCGCYDSPFTWLRDVWSSFVHWITGERVVCPGENKAFKTATHGLFGGTSDNYFSSEGPSGWIQFDDMDDIGDDNIGLRFENGNGVFYNNQGELFNAYNNILLGVLPNLSAQATKAHWLREHTEVMIQIDAYLKDFGGDTDEAKQASDEYYRLMRYDSQFASADINLIDYDAEEFLGVTALYEAFQEESWNWPDRDEVEFYLEMFQQQIVPLGVVFIPYGIGDAADIFLSCNDLSWGCVAALAGVLVPVDELYDIWKKSDEIKAAWKTVRNYSGLKSAWQLLRNCEKPIRTNPSILDGVRISLQRGVKSISSIVNYANVPYITSSTVEHILRGSGSGGVHHISALVADPDTYKIHNRIPTSNGCYKAEVWKNGTRMTPDKSFFPDEWSEYQVVNAIKTAYSSATKLPGNNNHWLGNSNGIDILFYKASDGRIISAFPNY